MFLKEYWPEISIFSILKIILQYQVNQKTIKQKKEQLNKQVLQL